MSINTLDSDTKTRVLQIINTLSREYHQNYLNISSQIHNILHDLTRVLIISQVKNTFDLINKLSDYAYYSAGNPQKQSQFKVNEALIKSIDSFFDYLFEQIRVFFQKSLEKNRKNIQMNDQPKNQFFVNKYLIELIISHLALIIS